MRDTCHSTSAAQPQTITDTQLAARITLAAVTATVGLDPERSVLYFDFILSHLSGAARTSLQNMDPAKYEFQSEFAKRYLSHGHAEGLNEGRAMGRVEGEVTLLSRLLALKFGALDAATTERLHNASTAELERWAEQILSATRLEDVFSESPGATRFT